MEDGSRSFAEVIRDLLIKFKAEPSVISNFTKAVKKLESCKSKAQLGNVQRVSEGFGEVVAR